jgi:hypothetical protein
VATSFYSFVLAGLAVWRVTHLLHAEDGPWGVIAKLRGAAGQSVVGRAFDCFFCASVWVAAPVAYALGANWTERLLLWGALSAVAILIEKWHSPATAPAFYVEDAAPPAASGTGPEEGREAAQEGDDVQLRQ